MKIVLSKKGFDSTYGVEPNPVFDKEGREFISMPIPAVNACDEIKYSAIEYECKNHRYNLGELVIKLKGKKVIKTGPLKKDIKKIPLEADSVCHFDPQLVRSKKDETNENWKPLFGQSGTAQDKLADLKTLKEDKNEDVLFLFFGHFKLIDSKPKKIKTFTAIYGWLQVEECIDLKNISDKDKDKLKKEKPYIAEHPHFKWQPHTASNTIYTATNLLKIGQSNPNIKGAGLFDRLYILTEEAEGAETNAKDRNLENFNFLPKTNWLLPICLSPIKNTNVTLSCNEKDATYNKGTEKRWKEKDENTCKLRAPQTFGQEFILDYDNAEQKTKEAIETWVRDLFA